MAQLQRAAPEHTLSRAREHLRHQAQRLRLAAGRTLQTHRQTLAARLAALAAYNPQNVLSRGYSITRDAQTRAIIRSLSQLREGLRLVTRISDGEFRSRAEDPRQGRLFEER